MTNISRRESGPSIPSSPSHEFEPLRFLRDFMRGERLFNGALSPAFDVKETKHNYIVKGDVPGYREDDVQVSLSGGRLTISGTREQEEKEEGDTYHYHERNYGSFTRSFTLPDDTDRETVNAELKDGQIIVTIAKSGAEKAKEIPINTKKSEQRRVD